MSAILVRATRQQFVLAAKLANGTVVSACEPLEKLPLQAVLPKLVVLPTPPPLPKSVLVYITRLSARKYQITACRKRIYVVEGDYAEIMRRLARIGHEMRALV